jgi:copper chaperone CopZ
MSENLNKSDKTVELQVEGMSCPGCEATVERIILGIKGIRKAKADFSSSTVSVEYDSAATGIPAIQEALSKAGYKLGSGVKCKGAKRKHNVYHFIAGAVILIAVCFIIYKTAGFNFIPNAKSTGNTATVQEAGSNTVQNISSTLIAGSYPMLTVQKGIPVKWDLQADASTLNSCNGTVIIPEFNIEKKLQPGDNIIEFTPTDAGTIPYSCKMGMIHSNIIVVDEPVTR